MPDGSESAPAIAEAPPTVNPPTITYYHTDILGSVRALTDAAGAVVGSRVDYFAFGETAAPPIGDPRKYLGGEVDPETAFEYLGARYYRTVWGRFTSPDPAMSGAVLTNPQLWNRYSYGLNSPLRFSDPSGMAPQELTDAADSEIDVQAIIESDAMSGLRAWGNYVDQRIASAKMSGVIVNDGYAFVLIHDALPESLQKYVTLDGNKIDAKEMAKAKTSDPLFNALLSLAQMKGAAVVFSSAKEDPFYYKDPGHYYTGAFVLPRSEGNPSNILLASSPLIIPPVPKDHMLKTTVEEIAHASLYYQGKEWHDGFDSVEKYIQLLQRSIGKK